MPIPDPGPPGGEPVSLAEAKAFLRLTTSDEDAIVLRLLTAARQLVEAELGFALPPAADTPRAVSQAMLLLVGWGFDRRDEALPAGLARSWLAPFRAVRL